MASSTSASAARAPRWSRSRRCPARRRAATSSASQAEDEDVLGADVLADLDVGAVERADRERAVQRELHVAGAGGFHAGRRDLLGEVRRGNDRLGEAHVVVRQEHDLEPSAHDGVAVDDARDVVGELDDELRLVVARGRLAGEDLHPRHPGARRLRAHRVVERDRLEDVEELPLVLVDALDVDVEQRVGIEAEAQRARRRAARARPCSSRRTAAKRSRNDASSASGTSASSRVGVVLDLGADRVDDELGQARVRLVEPAAERDAVGLVDDAVRIDRVAGRGTPSGA